MKVDFSGIVKNANGEPKTSDPINELISQYLESYNGYEQGEKAAMWSIIGDIRRKGDVELEPNEVKMLKKYWNKIDVRLDLDMAVKEILDEALDEG